MPRDPRIDLVNKAICAGQIQWSDSAQRRMRDDREMRRFTQIGINGLLSDFVANQGGQIKCRKEQNEDWLNKHPNDPWWYAVIVPVPPDIPDFRRGLFVKVKLLWEDGDKDEDAWIEVISPHKQLTGKIL